MGNTLCKICKTPVLIQICDSCYTIENQVRFLIKRNPVAAEKWLTQQVAEAKIAVQKEKQ